MTQPVPDPDIFVKPSPDDVAALLRARTQDEHDDEVGAWNDETRPTLDQVTRIIDQAASVVLSRTGKLDSPPLQCDSAGDVRTNAQTAITMLACMLIELSYFPEQVRSDRSAFEDYRSLWNDMMSGLIDAAAECRGGEVIPDVPGGGEAGPSWAFPVDVGGMVGWQSKW